MSEKIGLQLRPERLLGREVPDEENGAWANAERLEGLERYADLRSAGP